MRFVRRVLPCLSLIFLHALAPAQGDEYTEIRSKPIKSVADITDDNFMFSIELKLDAAILSALQNNLGHQQDELALESAKNSISAAEAAFDTQFTSSVTSSNARQTGRITEIGLVTPDQETDTFVVNAGLAKRLSTGTEISLSTSASRLSSDFGTGPTSITANSRFSFRIMQPLMGNGGAVANRAELESTRYLATAAQHELRRKAEVLVSRIHSLYWDLALAETVERIHFESVLLAQELVEMTENKFKRGRKSRLDVLEAQGLLSIYEQELISARYSRATSADVLRLAINGKTTAANSVLIKTQSKPSKPSVNQSLAELEISALMFRSDLLLAQDRLAASIVSQKAARRNKLPELDLTASFGTGGTDESFERAFDSLRDNQSPQWSVGLAFSVPFGNRAAHALFVEASIRRRRNQIAIQELESNIILEVRTAHRKLEAALRKLRIAERHTETSKELLKAARSRYDLGMIDQYRLHESARNSTESEVTLVRRLFEAVIAHSELQLVVGVDVVNGLQSEYLFDE